MASLLKSNRKSAPMRLSVRMGIIAGTLAAVILLTFYPISELTRVVMVQRGLWPDRGLYIFPMYFDLSPLLTFELISMWFSYLTAIATVGIVLNWTMDRP